MFIIVDDFYRDPDSVRDFALKQPFNVFGNYPGRRTGACTGEYFYNMRSEFEQLLNKRIDYWPTEYNSSFQITTEKDKTWIHRDSTEWAAVIYLTPDAPANSGTCIFRHKETGLFKWWQGCEHDFNKIKTDASEWEVLDSAANVYNRLVLYHGNLYHSSNLPGFGDSLETGRLFQTFFFNTRR